jgi:hypothetical protein
MPKTAVDEDDRAMSRKDKIGGTWKVFPVEPKPQSRGVSGLTDTHFGRRVFCPNPGHQPRTAVRRQPIYQRRFSTLLIHDEPHADQIADYASATKPDATSFDVAF